MSIRNILKAAFLTVVACLALKPVAVYAHQPRIVETATYVITNPEVSQAFYGELRGAPVEFHIVSKNQFKLYVGLLVPDISDIQKNISARIYRRADGREEQVAFLDGTNFIWTSYFEEFARDTYWWGPEFKAESSVKGKELEGKPVPAGEYRIVVTSPSDRGKYVLVTGFQELFPFTEILNATVTVPRLKAQFFAYPVPRLVTSPYVSGYLIGIYIISFILSFLYRWLTRSTVAKYMKKSKPRLYKNIGISDRIFRAAIGIALFFWAVATTWSPLLFILSGFTLFEAVFSWCAFYQLIGKQTCPVG